MKTAMIILLAIVIAAIGFMFYQGRLSRDGKAPGLVDGRLAACPDTPNCVLSESIGSADSSHAIAPIEMTIEGRPIDALKRAVAELGGQIVDETDAYLAATFTSTVFGFVDDLELRVDDSHATGAAVIHVRSSSRVGKSDLGANRKRVEALRSRLAGG